MATIPRASADPETPAIAATKVRAVSWATPGIVISRRQATEALAMRLMSASIAATAVITAVRAAIKPAWGRETGEITEIRVVPGSIPLWSHCARVIVALIWGTLKSGQITSE
jgi:hypothetical protein